jgi:putative spermidine/putrescine transport system substrate-binding protein
MPSHDHPSRRSILWTIGAVASAGPFFHVTHAKADKGELVVVGWGGSKTTIQREIIFEPFERISGIRIRDDGPPEPAKLKAMVESGNITWDILDTDIPAILTMAKNNLLEPIDYTKVDSTKISKIPEILRHKYGIGEAIYSFNIVYNTRRFPKGTHPKSWADFWNAQAFKGGRSWPFRGGIAPQHELALIADGVPLNALYPVDNERAWKSMDRLKPLITKWYANHAEAIQLVSSGEVDLCCTIGARGISAKRDGAPVDVEYNEGKLAPDNWAIVKGARNQDAIYQFLNFAIDGKLQAEFVKRIPYGPSSQDAFNYLTEAEAVDLTTNPANLSRQFWNNTSWWGEPGPDGKTNLEAQTEQYAKWMVRRS